MNNNNATINKAAFDYMKEIFPLAFKELSFTNNVLIYKNLSVMLGNFDLQEFLNHNSYIIRDLSSMEVFEIIKTHAITINKIGPATKAMKETTVLKPISVTGESIDYTSPTALLTLDQFILLANKDEDFTPQDMTLLNRFFDHLQDLLLYEDFLVSKVSNILETIKNIILDIEITYGITKKNSTYIINEYRKRLALAKEIKGGRISEKAEDFSLILTSGYVSAAVIISVVLNVGIAIALLLFFK